jgi:Zn-dependent peptidase ImmA (M78 family)/transcriptional regulator with XRE-family HTH domain
MIRSAQFVGARLIEARIARGLSAAALAELLGISASAVSQYENQRIAPKGEVLEHLSRQLNVPAAFFFKAVLADEPERPMFWRSLGLASKANRILAEQRFRWLREIVTYVHSHLEFPPIDLPKVAPGDILSASLDDIEDAATATRRAWGLGAGPIDDVSLLLENHGIVVTRTALGDRGLDAFSYWSAVDGLPYVVLGTDKSSAVRSRYDALHELGHLLMHSAVDSKTAAGKRAHHTLEAQAFRYASAMALPADSFLAELWAPTLDTFLALKSKWKVSIGVMIYRCAELQVVTASQAQRLWINYSRRGWRNGEPLDERLAPEQPRLLRRCFDLLTSSGTRSRRDIVADLALPANVIEALAGLPTGYFNDDFGMTVALTPRLRQANPDAKPASVVSFDPRRK